MSWKQALTSLLATNIDEFFIACGLIVIATVFVFFGLMGAELWTGACIGFGGMYSGSRVMQNRAHAKAEEALNKVLG